MTWLRTGACVLGLIATAACGAEGGETPGMGAGPVAGSAAPHTATGTPPVIGAGRVPGLAGSAPSVRPPPPPPSTTNPPVQPTTPPANPTTPPTMAAGGAPGAPGAAKPPTTPPPPAMMAPPFNGEPTIPEVAGDCPDFQGGIIMFMGLGGITVSGGGKAASPAPMVFYWHGTGSTSGEYASMASSVAAGVSSEGGVLVSFQGSTGGDLLSGTSVFGMGDFALTDQMVACAVKNNNVDPKRIYTLGCSAGGLFSTAMAAIRSNYIAAAAPNSGGLTVPVTFQNAWTPPLMTIHGAPGADVVIVDFSETSATADKAFKGRGGFVVNCNHGGGHCGGGDLGGTAWDFFKAHPYGTNPSPWASALPAGTNSACMIYN